MSKKLAATKANLLALKDSYNFATKGYDLLDKKRTVLIKEMMDLNKEAAELQEKIEIAFKKSYESLIEATITMGSGPVYEMSHSIAIEEEYEIISKSVMGVEIPKIKYKVEEPKTEYSLHNSTVAFDKASLDMHDIKYLIYQLAELETGIFRLAQEIKKTGKKANALEKVQIPKYKKMINEIENELEEKERDDFFRLKKVKDRKEA
jgi:V/A-type H+-transporting ATPase subunit D